MSGQNKEIGQILDTLGRLKNRVNELTDQGPDDHPQDADQPSGVVRNPMSLMRISVAELDDTHRASDVPNVFSRFAARTGLRFLVLKRWRSGLQVVAERNVSLPAEAKQKQPNGKAPIPSAADDIFCVTGRERQIYAGPVPIRAFPLDLTLLLGRGTQDRRIVILPLPSRDRWSTFVYLDGGPEHDASLAVAEFLARHAVDRMRLLQLGEVVAEGEVASLLKHEMCRRRERQTTDVAADAPSLARREPSQSSSTRTDMVDTVAQSPDAEPQPLVLDGQTSIADAIPRTARMASQARAEADAIVDAWESALLGGAPRNNLVLAARGEPIAPMAPEDILHKSGDLPAMPKAALHILSVIEDPRTTATRLEKAVAMDQALTAKILRIANSPFYGAVREIKTVSEAIVRLGFVTIRNWTLVTATKSVFLGAGAGVLFHKIWRQSVLSAMASQLVAQSLRKSDPETVFVGGLMQNIGQLVLARSHPELFQQVLSISAEEQLPYYVVEQELLGFDHGDLGALLIQEWNLSEELEQAVRWHHRLDHPDIVCTELAAMIALGEEIAACSGSAEDDEEIGPEPGLAAETLGISSLLVSRLREQARQLSIDPSFFS